MHIEIKQARKQFGAVRALDEVSLHIHEGELFFLLGPSGCGKTTLLRTLAGFHELDSGCVCFDGRDMTGVPPHQRHTGMMFQGYALWPHMTVAENVAFGLEVRKLPRAEQEQRTRQVLERVQITELAERKPNELSGGQQQRVALARTLVVEPACLLLDEPLANLDAKLRLEMRTEIRRLCKDSGLTAVYVTHDQKEALSMADRLAVMHQGRVLQIGSPREVYSRPVSTFVAEFIGETNFCAGRIKDIHSQAIHVETPCGLLESSVFPAGLIIGQSVTLSLRPEALRLYTDWPADVSCNLFPAISLNTIYLGSSTQHLLDVAGLKPFVVSEPNSRHNPGPGSKVYLGINPEDVTILAEDGSP